MIQNNDGRRPRWAIGKIAPSVQAIEDLMSILRINKLLIDAALLDKFSNQIPVIRIIVSNQHPFGNIHK